jgi:very-short-patch-repair endonuclease
VTSRIPLPASISGAPFSHAQGLAAGLGKTRLRGRDLARPYHGVRHPVGVPLDLVARCHAFQTRMPRGAFFNSVTAAALMRLPLPRALKRSAILHVAVPSPRRASAAKGVVGHKVQVVQDDLQNWQGIRIGSPERTWCELASVLQLGDLVAVGDYLIHWELPISSSEKLAKSARDFPGRRGAAVRRRALELLSDRAESPQESRFRVMLVQAKIEGFLPNYKIVVRGKKFRGDLVLPARKFILEYQGEYHNDPKQWKRDMTRDSTLASVGWSSMQINSDDLEDPAELATRIRSALELRPTFA